MWRHSNVLPMGDAWVSGADVSCMCTREKPFPTDVGTCTSGVRLGQSSFFVLRSVVSALPSTEAVLPTILAAVLYRDARSYDWMCELSLNWSVHWSLHPSEAASCCRLNRCFFGLGNGWGSPSSASWNAWFFHLKGRAHLLA